MPIWLAEEKELVKLPKEQRMAANHWQNLELELEDVRKITKR